MSILIASNNAAVVDKQEIIMFRQQWQHLQSLIVEDVSTVFSQYAQLPETEQESIQSHYNKLIDAVTVAREETLDTDEYKQASQLDPDNPPAAWSPKQLSKSQRDMIQLLEDEDPSMAQEWLDHATEQASLLLKIETLNEQIAIILSTMDRLEDAVLAAHGITV